MASSDSILRLTSIFSVFRPWISCEYLTCRKVGVVFEAQRRAGGQRRRRGLGCAGSSWMFKVRAPAVCSQPLQYRRHARHSGPAYGSTVAASGGACGKQAAGGSSPHTGGCPPLSA